MAEPMQEVIIDYTNWRGERGLRRIIPRSIQFENSEWHPCTQWILYAVDVERGASREFAMAGIHAWFRHMPVVPQPGPDVENAPKQ